MTIEEVKRAHNLADIVRSYGIKIGRGGMCKCPFHEDEGPSMKIYPDGHFHCFGCQAAGDVLDFVIRMDGTDFKTAFLKLGGTYDDADPAETRRAIMKARSASWLRDLLEDFRRQRLRSIVEDINRLRDLGAEEWPYSPAWCMLQDRLFDLIRTEEAEAHGSS